MSRKTHTGDGTTKDFAIGFPYLHPSHLNVFVNNVQLERGEDWQTYNDEDPKGLTNRIKFTAAPDNGHAIKIVRNTPLNSYSQNPQMANYNGLQALYRMQEEADSNEVAIPVNLSQTDVLAGTANYIEAPFDGYITRFQTQVTAAVTTGGAVTLTVQGVAVDGASITIANSAAIGTLQEDTPTASHATTKVRKGQRVGVVPDAAFDTAGAFQATVFFKREDQAAEFTD